MAREAHDVSEARRQKGSLYVSSSTTSFENAPSIATTQGALAPVEQRHRPPRHRSGDLQASRDVAGSLRLIRRPHLRALRIVIVDNENSPATERIVRAFDEQTRELWGEPEADAEGSTHRVVYAPANREHRRCPAGFSAGKPRVNLRWGAEWFWLMDDTYRLA